MNLVQHGFLERMRVVRHHQQRSLLRVWSQSKEFRSIATGQSMQRDAERLARLGIAVSLVRRGASHFAKALERSEILSLHKVDILDQHVEVNFLDAGKPGPV